MTEIEWEARDHLAFLDAEAKAIYTFFLRADIADDAYGAALFQNLREYRATEAVIVVLRKSRDYMEKNNG